MVTLVACGQNKALRIALACLGFVFYIPLLGMLLVFSERLSRWFIVYSGPHEENFGPLAIGVGLFLFYLLALAVFNTLRATIHPVLFTVQSAGGYPQAQTVAASRTESVLVKHSPRPRGFCTSPRCGQG